MGRSGVEARTLTPSLSAPRVMVILIATLTRDLPSYPDIEYFIEFELKDRMRRKEAEEEGKKGEDLQRRVSTAALYRLRSTPAKKVRHWP